MIISSNIDVVHEDNSLERYACSYELLIESKYSFFSGKISSLFSLFCFPIFDIERYFIHL